MPAKDMWSRCLVFGDFLTKSFYGNVDITVECITKCADPVGDQMTHSPLSFLLLLPLSLFSFRFFFFLERNNLLTERNITQNDRKEDPLP